MTHVTIVGITHLRFCIGNRGGVTILFMAFPFQIQGVNVNMMIPSQRFSSLIHKHEFVRKQQNLGVFFDRRESGFVGGLKSQELFGLPHF